MLHGSKTLQPSIKFADLHDERLDMLLQLLKKDEVKTICKEFKVSKTGNKQDLVNALLSMHKSQPTLLGVSPMLNRFVSALSTFETVLLFL